MPELPEMEAWRRQLNNPVSTFPIAKAGPAHIATLKTFDPPLDALEGRHFRGAERRGKRLLFPTDDGELVLLVHLMTAGRLRFLRAGEKGPKTPAFALEFEGGSKLVLGDEEVERLAAAIDSELERGLELRETGAPDEKTYRVHRRLGEPCHVCGTPIAQVDFEEHTIFYCPACQTGGRVLKDRRLSRLLR